MEARIPLSSLTSGPSGSSVSCQRRQCGAVQWQEDLGPLSGSAFPSCLSWEKSASLRRGCVCRAPCSVPGVRGAPAVHIQVPSRLALGWAFAAVMAGGKHSCLVSPVLHFIFISQFLRLKLFWLNLLH